MELYANINGNVVPVAIVTLCGIWTTEATYIVEILAGPDAGFHATIRRTEIFDAFGAPIPISTVI
jgi:hypothetical protein